MGGIVSVGKGSMNPPQLLSVAYTGDPESRDVLAVVGKGITYDSGGLSLKTRAGQLNMKSDMAGAATAFGYYPGAHVAEISGQCSGGYAFGRKYSFRNVLSCR